MVNLRICYLLNDFSNKDLEAISYKNVGLTQRYTYNSAGVPTMVEWFESYDAGTNNYTTIVVKETITYGTNAINIYDEIITQVDFYQQTDSDVIAGTYTKTVGVNNDNGLRIAENGRRYLVRSCFVATVLTLSSETNAMTLWDGFINEIILYWFGNRQPLIDAITADILHPVWWEMPCYYDPNVSLKTWVLDTLTF